MEKVKGNCVRVAVRATQENAKETQRRWLVLVACAWAMVLAATGANADEIKPDMVEIPVGPGQACIKYHCCLINL